MASGVDYALNTSFNLTFKLGPILSFPSRFIARIRLIDELFNQDPARKWDPDSPNAHIMHLSTSGSIISPFPGPWGFLTSGYALILFVMVCHLVLPNVVDTINLSPS
jgi:hypothetical protein